ncbi:hypothetical protein SAMN04488115_10234 [Bosea lathyri]|uniref:Uncharacterized protein n=1 Tax=Bosea lathyri TaxID=1036778 RepID=A0A1H5UVA1_9HYPH|nr:hypothetical protein SAMN04488115_10234 [Bosea lathyri]
MRLRGLAFPNSQNGPYGQTNFNKFCMLTAVGKWVAMATAGPPMDMRLSAQEI